jgi:pectinesterase
VKQFLSIFAAVLLPGLIHAQPGSGLTAKPDTSYSVRSAYEGIKKSYPESRPVLLKNLPGVKVQKDLAYLDRSGRRLLLDVFYPDKKQIEPRIGILIIHGGGWRSGNKSMHHPMAERLAAMGYVCFTPEYRLSTEALFPAAVHDIKAAISWVRKNAVTYGIDPEKIVAAGHSAGGQLAAFMGATNHIAVFEEKKILDSLTAEVNAVINMDGIVAFIHPESGEGDDSKKISAATNWLGQSKEQNPGLWKEASPLTYAGYSVPTLFINSSVARMHAGRDDYIKMLRSQGVYSAVRTFDSAPHAFPLFDTWFEPTIQVIDSFLKEVLGWAQYKTIIVSQDGKGDYRTLQEAFDHIPPNDLRNKYSIFLKKGIYREKLHLDSSKIHVSIHGDGQFNTIIIWSDHTGKLSPAGDTINTRTSWTFKVTCPDFQAYQITFRNDAGYSAGQAVAVEAGGTRARFYNCRFIGNQDVLFTNNEKSLQYYEDCYIEGTTDFIFGSSTAWFEHCHIHSKKNSHITAASTPAENEFGYVFNNCVLTGDTSLHNVSLGRPWRPFANVIYMHCYIGAHIKNEGWSNWNNTENYKTTKYAEYKNYGPSSDPLKRVAWSRQLTDEEAEKIRVRQVLKWYPW